MAIKFNVENVVYILGAGFSAQFGLPIMSNFLEKSKDMYALKDYPENDLKHIDFFGKIYNEIDKLRRCKDFYASDMTNIEEILSLFEMGKMLGVESKQQIDFQKFIADVIKYYTPSPEQIHEEKQHFEDIFLFLLHMFGRKNSEDFWPDQLLPNYSILTFNYDDLLENILQYCKTQKKGAYTHLQLSPNSLASDRDTVPYIKLHGTVSNSETIITPTWKKAFCNDETSYWKIAGKLLCDANHIRIIGYSLPVTDSYLKYFLKWGAAHESNLKSVDVICLDDEKHSVENRYKNFIHNKLNFYNMSTGDYLKAIRENIEKAHRNSLKKVSNGKRFSW